MKRDKPWFLPGLLFLAAWFFAGIILGQVAAERMPNETGQELNRYLREYVSLDTSAFAGVSFLTLVLLYFRYPVLAFLMGFSSIGVILLPLCTVVFGFSLSFSASCFAASFGGQGVLLALGAFGLRCAVTLPCYFWLAVPAFMTSVALARISLGRGQRSAPPNSGGESWRRLAVCAGALMIALCADLFFGQRFFHYLLEQWFS